MKAWGFATKHQGLRVSLLKTGYVTFCFLLAVISASANAATTGNIDRPTSFFTNVAARLFRSQLNLDLHNIQVYPTNQYSASVHRLLQVTANIYDSATNRTYGVPGATNGFPTVFRPLFRRVQDGTNTFLIIADFREVTGTGMANPVTAPPLIELNAGNVSAVPLLGDPFRTDSLEPMIAGIPLIIGVKKGFPGFNEFEMQTCFNVSRGLEFRRAVPNGPVTTTNQMYVAAVSNVFGLEAWNSYSNSYPRNLELLANVAMTAVMTNEFGDVVLSNRFAYTAMTNIPARTWQGWAVTNFASSFVLPWGSGLGFMFLTNSSYINQVPWFIPQTDVFYQSNAGTFYAPHWWLMLSTRLVFMLVDTDANRIVDYVNLQHSDDAVDIYEFLVQGASCALGDLANPSEQWCTNRLHGSTDAGVPTVGIVNQIAVGVQGTSNWTDFQLDPHVGLDVVRALDSFRFNLLGIVTPGQTFFRSNAFYAPFMPYASIYINTSWQANDPFVHYTIADLLDLTFALTNRITSLPTSLPMRNLGFVNIRYSSWGGNPYSSLAQLSFETAVKDPMITRPDDWNFPCNQGLNPAGLGGVHRGTPWQTLFLKSTNILETTNLAQALFIWEEWTGNAAVRPDWKRNGGLIPDAWFTAPTNDWSVVGLLTALFNTNDLHALASVNQNSTDAWAGLLDGMTVLTNSSGGQFDSALMTSNSPQAVAIAAGLNAAREGKPNHVFLSVGDVLATPELSDATPWLNSTNGFISDAALEIIPSQLLPRLRPDSIASIVFTNGIAQIQFTGIDDYAYAVEESSNLVDWSFVSTNFPSNGIFSLKQMPATNSAQTFYRSALVQ